MLMLEIGKYPRLLCGGLFIIFSTISVMHTQHKNIFMAALLALNLFNLMCNSIIPPYEKLSYNLILAIREQLIEISAFRTISLQISTH